MQILPVAADWAAAVTNVAPHSFDNVILFIDGSLRKTCRPGPSLTKLPPGVTLDQCQRAQYSGHKHHHGFKVQALIAPNGISVHIYGPIDGRRSDVFMLAESGILPQLSFLTFGGIDYLVYGDSAYPITRNMTAPFPSFIATPGSVEARVNEVL